MNLLVFLDVETSGLPLWNKPSSDPEQPHICQAAAVLVDEDTRDVISSFDMIAKPDGWIIPDETAEIHGITTERASEVGVNECLIVSAIWELCSRASHFVAHNAPFERRLIRIALKRFMGDDEADIWKLMPAKCTQKEATALMDLPPTAKMKAAGRHHKKTANLSEAYEFFTGEPLKEAHTALADTLACMKIYFHMKDLGKSELAPDPDPDGVSASKWNDPDGDDDGDLFP